MRLISIGPDPQIGWATAGFNPGDGNGVGDDGLSWGADGARSQLWHIGDQKWSVSWEAGDVVGFAADLANGRAEEALVPARDHLCGNQPVS